ncbi:aminoglycoside phosphotransferase family protein [Celeribacter baekdonensis]|uniref:aminoglycoside phosphotransferase family protein n=1 Tax=Celeribacter baekdonensis TaxID=875171 RepID=UPI0030D72E86|tara:strand:+ start:189338 stop:190198 length:861 start_codon:yes stop_codon:yes gene_type:complete
MLDPTPFLTLWSLSAPTPLKTDGHAHVWRVCDAQGRPAALKLFQSGKGGSERAAEHWDRAFGSSGLISRLRAAHGDALLFDWAEGAPLGDLSRNGQDDLATSELARLTAALLRAAPNQTRGCAALADHARALRNFTGDSRLSPPEHLEMMRAKALIEVLLSSPERVQPMHGDLHHDNVIGTPGHWTVIDPKVIFGDPHYEPANAFRNPKGAANETLSVARFARMAEVYAYETGLDRARLLDWAAVKCALSICWTLASPTARPPHHDMIRLPRLLSLSRGGPLSSAL